MAFDLGTRVDFQLRIPFTANVFLFSLGVTLNDKFGFDGRFNAWANQHGRGVSAALQVLFLYVSGNIDLDYYDNTEYTG